MATNRSLEMIVGGTYPNAMRHLQQLIMDADACAKHYGKKTIFGKEKFQPSMDKFISTIGVCVHALVEDNQLDDPENTEAAMEALNLALSRCEATYSSWPLAFKFWNDWYVQFKYKLVRDRNPQKKESAPTTDQSLDQLQEGADSGDAMAQLHLGGRYYEGEGVPKDVANAVVWWRKAAAQGNALAQYNLGIMYKDGDGVPQDYVQAHKWFNLAAVTLTEKVGSRDRVAELMTPEQIAEAQKLAREWKPKK